MNKNLETVNCDLCGADNYSVKYKKDGFNIVQCRNCGMVYVNPRLTSEAINNLYDDDYFHGKGFDKSIEYKEEFERNSVKIDLIDWDISTIKQFLQFKESVSVSPQMLDAGCGMGLFLWKAQKAGFDVEGLELSPYAAKFVQSLGINVLNTSIDNTELKSEKYDSVVMREVIEHLPAPKSAIQKIYSSLKKGGVLFMTTGNYDCPERKLRGKNWFYFMPEGHINIFSSRTMTRYLKDAGFSKVKVTNQGDLLMHFLLKNKIIETDRFKPANIFRRIIFEKVRFINHFISSGLRIYAVK